MSEETVMEQVKVKEEVVRLETRIKELRQDIEELWADQQKATYELVSVFIHRGETCLPCSCGLSLTLAASRYRSQWTLFHLPTRQQEPQAMAQV